MARSPIDFQKLQDADSDWYWVPKSLVNDFERSVQYMSNVEYMDNPEFFDKFEYKFADYRTGGCSNLEPLNWDEAVKKEWIIINSK